MSNGVHVRHLLAACIQQVAQPVIVNLQHRQLNAVCPILRSQAGTCLQQLRAKQGMAKQIQTRRFYSALSMACRLLVWGLTLVMDLGIRP